MKNGVSGSKIALGQSSSEKRLPLRRCWSHLCVKDYNGPNLALEMVVLTEK